MKSYITYEYWNPISNSIFYVGAGQKRRANWHLWEAKKFMNSNAPITGNRHKINTIIKILKSNFLPVIRTVFEGNRDAAFDHEIFLIKHYGRADLGTGPLTNLTDGGYDGNHGLKMSVETKRKLSEMRKGEKNAFYGHHHTQENKLLQSKLRKEKYIGNGNPFYGCHHTEESKNKISNTLKQKIESGDIIPKLHTEAHKLKMSVMFTGEDNPFAKEYVVTDPFGRSTKIKSLKLWCEQNNFSRNTFVKMLNKGSSPNRGPAKGWAITSIKGDNGSKEKRN